MWGCLPSLVLILTTALSSSLVISHWMSPMSLIPLDPFQSPWRGGPDDPIQPIWGQYSKTWTNERPLIRISSLDNDRKCWIIIPGRDNTVLQRSPRPAPGPGDHQPIRARDPGTWPIRSRARSHTSPSNGGYCILYGPRPQSLHYLTTSCDGKQVQEKCAAFTPLIQLDNEIEWERVLAESGAIWERERGDLVVSNSA